MTSPIVVLNIRREPFYRRAAFESGFKRLGYTIVDGPARPRSIHDILCSWNRKQGADEQAADEWERRGGTVIIVENGYLAKEDKTYYAISVHGHCGSGWSGFVDGDRFSALGFEIAPWRTDGTEVVIRAQRGIGSKLMASPPRWAENLANKIGGRVVPHPGDKNKFAIDEANLKNAKELHIWSSAMGVRALVRGIPVHHHAPHWICAGYRAEGREVVLQRMAAGQWHFDEVATGEPFARMKAMNWGPRWV
jgi:hypothetical protein